jgi:ParB family chromosome partitioning protein
MLDPATLLLDLNIREAKLDTAADRGFVASIKDHGVIEPIVAVRTEDGQVRVRHGHRRTLAAIETAKPLVPVFIAGTEDKDEANRIARQWHENQHRAALTNVGQRGRPTGPARPVRRGHRQAPALPQKARRERPRRA